MQLSIVCDGSAEGVSCLLYSYLELYHRGNMVSSDNETVPVQSGWERAMSG